MNRDQFLHELKNSAVRSRWLITKKAMNLPYKVFFPKLLQKVRASYPVIARTFWGGKLKVMLPEVVSTYIYRYGYFDEEVCFYTISSLDEGATFIDIGAHFGSFSLLASKLVGEKGKVISIDPTPSTFRLLEWNLKQFAPHSNYKTYNIALYDCDGKTPFYDFGLSHSAYNSILGSRNDEIKNSDSYKIEVETRTLDSLVRSQQLDRIDFIKIDAESAELAILKGGQETLNKYSPKVAVEIGDTGLNNAPKSIEIISFLQGLGYTPFEFFDGSVVPHLLRDNYQKEKLSNYNLLFIKK